MSNMLGVESENRHIVFFGVKLYVAAKSNVIDINLIYRL